MKLEKVGQVALVVKDVDKAAEYLQRELGIGPFTILNFDDGKAVYKGQEVGCPMPGCCSMVPHRHRVGRVHQQRIGLKDGQSAPAV